MQVHQEFVSAGVNRVVNALAWSQGSCVAYGAHHMVALYDPKAAEVVATMTGHTSMVGCVAWVPHALTQHLPLKSVELLVSGSTEGELRVWAVHLGGRAEQPWEQLAVLQGHTGPVTGLAFHAMPPSSSSPSGGFMMVSTAGDSALRVWECHPAAPPAAEGSGRADADCTRYGQASWGCTSTIPVGTQMQHTVALTHLPGHTDWLLLVSGGTDSRLHLYCRPPGHVSFHAALKLPGHEGWIRSLALHHVMPHAPAHASAPTELLIATASQDRYGRIWRVCVEGGGSPAPTGPQSVEEEEDALDAIMRYAPRPGFEAAGQCFSVTLESLLIGHEDWVHSVCWQPQPVTAPPPSEAQALGSVPMQRTSLCLLSASMDRTMMLWTYEASSGLWMNVSSMGDAGAACLGYFGGVFSPDGACIMAHGFTGAVHLWERCLPAAPANGARHASWAPRHALGGHWDAVTGVTWGCDGSCVMSVSADQTARIFTATGGGGHWCEVARPQVHGHDFSCIAAIPRGTTSASSAYVSGSEEKVLRVMEGTQAFLDSLRLLKGTLLEDHPQGPKRPEASREEGAGGTRARAFGAAVSALGLTNKMVMEDGAAARNAGVGSGMPGGAYEEGPDFVPNAVPSVVGDPPLEEHLAQNTLWPEGYKLYGHGDMLYCCSASPDGAYLASACVAKSEPQAAVWVWDVAGGTWKGVAQLMAHALTVTQLAWSHSSDLLASCSRDRTFSLFQRLPPQPPNDQSAPGVLAQHKFRLVHRQKAAHMRVIWGISWSHDDALLATGARDNLVKIWGVSRQAPTQPTSDVLPEGSVPGVAVTPKPLLVLPAFPTAVTAVAWGPCPAPVQEVEGVSSGRGYILAIGLESGQLQVWRVHVEGSGLASAQCAWQSMQFGTCAAQVNSLAWRAGGAGLGPECLQLAVGSNDHSVRVLKVTFSSSDGR